MTIEEFAEITQRVIAEDDFEDFLPTVCYPARQVVRVLEGVPAGVDVASTALKWATRGATDTDEEFLVAFKCGANSFKITHRSDGRIVEDVFEVS